MNLKPISLSGLATIAGLVLLPATHASPWWACPSGYDTTVQTRNSTSNVRCMKPEDTKAFNECPNATANGVTVGTGHKRNYSGSRDKCVGYIGGAPVIVLDLSVLEPAYLYAIGVIVIALGVTYWLVSTRTEG